MSLLQNYTETAPKRFKIDETSEEIQKFQVVISLGQLEALVSADQYMDVELVQNQHAKIGYEKAVFNLNKDYDKADDIKELLALYGDSIKRAIDENNFILWFQACKKFGNTILYNEIFHWILIHIMLSSSKLTDDQLDLIDKDLLHNLLKHESFVVTSEFELYRFLKRWAIRDYTRKKSLKLRIFQPAELLDAYKDIFSYVRLDALLSYPERIHEIFSDQIFPAATLNRVLFPMYTSIIKTNNLFAEDVKREFRFARRISSNREVDIITNFFYAGVVLEFKFNNKRISVERLGPSRETHLMNYDQTSIRTTATLFGPYTEINGRCSSEETPETNIDLRIGKERLIHTWRKAVTFPCIIFIKLQISCGQQVIDIC